MTLTWPGGSSVPILMAPKTGALKMAGVGSSVKTSAVAKLRFMSEISLLLTPIFSVKLLVVHLL